MKTRWLSVICLAAAALGADTPEAAGQLRFVQVVPAAANTTVADEDGDYPAYIEIRSLELGIVTGHYLTDNAQEPRKWQVPGGYVLTSGQTIRVFASGKNRTPLGPNGQLHTNFTYDCSVPYCGLFNAQGVFVHSFSDRTDRCACPGVDLIGGQMIARVLIPSEDIGTAWTQVGYNDREWMRGPLGVGYDVGRSPYRDGLILYHTMDRRDISGTIVRDVSGPTLHDGAMAGAAAMSNPPALIAEGLAFPGVATSHVKVSHHSEIEPGTKSFSAVIWFNAERDLSQGRVQTEYLVAKGRAVQGEGGWVMYRTAANTYVALSSSIGGYSVALGRTAPKQWHQVVLVRDGTSNTLVGYLNGAPIGSTPLSAVAVDDVRNTKDLLVGRDEAGQFPYQGRLDDFAIWGRALNPAQVQELFAVGAAGKSFFDPASLPGGGKLYGGLIGTDVQEVMRGVNATAYVRVPFNLSAFPAFAARLVMRVHYDDGFRAYLNGAPIAERRVPKELKWDSGAASDRPDGSALIAETIDISPYVGLLRQGANVLAFHALNGARDAERFLIDPVALCAGRGADQPGQCEKVTNGTEFWVAFPENYEQEPDNPLELRLCIGGAPGTKGIVEVPGLGWAAGFTIAADGIAKVLLPKAVELDGADDIEYKGVHILAGAPVAVYGLTHMDYTSDVFLGLPNTCIGTEYLLLTYKNVHSNVPLLQGTQLGIVAPFDRTRVTITPRQKVGSHAAGVPFSITLHRGRTYQLRNEAGAPADLSGTLIAADKPIGVFGAHRCANVAAADEFFADTILEQLLPLNEWSAAHYVAPLMTRGGDTLRIMAARDKTPVLIDGALKAVLNRGEFYEMILANPGPGAPGAKILSEYPLQVAQYSHSANYDNVIDSDPFMALIQPRPSWLDQYVICAPPTSAFPKNYLTVVTDTTANRSQVRIDGTQVVTLAGAQTGSFSDGYVYVRAPVPASSTGAHRLTGRSTFAVTVYGFDEFDSYGHPGGMRFSDSEPPVIVCPAEIVLRCQKPGADCEVVLPDLREVIGIYDDCTPSGQIAVVQSPAPGTRLKLGTYEVTITATDGNGNRSACVIVVLVKEMWEQEQFGLEIVSDPALEATVWGATADPDEDGLLNAQEKAGGSDPTDARDQSSVLRPEWVEQEGEEFLKLWFRRPVNSDPGSIYLEGCRDLAVGGWQSGADLFEELALERVPLPGGEYEEIAYRALATLDPAVTGYFVRLAFVAGP